MRTTRAITLHLDAKDHERLQAEAERLGLSPAMLARIYVRDRLIGTETEAERKRKIALEALERLEALWAELDREGSPPIDAERLIREGRDELARRIVP